MSPGMISSAVGDPANDASSVAAHLRSFSGYNFISPSEALSNAVDFGSACGRVQDYAAALGVFSRPACAQFATIAFTVSWAHLACFADGPLTVGRIHPPLPSPGIFPRRDT